MSRYQAESLGIATCNRLNASLVTCPTWPRQFLAVDVDRNATNALPKRRIEIPILTLGELLVETEENSVFIDALETTCTATGNITLAQVITYSAIQNARVLVERQRLTVTDILCSSADEAQILSIGTPFLSSKTQEWKLNGATLHFLPIGQGTCFFVTSPAYLGMFITDDVDYESELTQYNPNLWTWRANWQLGINPHSVSMLRIT